MLPRFAAEGAAKAEAVKDGLRNTRKVAGCDG